MNKEKFYIYFKTAIIFLGICCLTFASANLPYRELGWYFLVILGFSVLLSPRLSLTLPRSNFTVTASDAVIIFTFLVYGGEAAVILAVLEMAANCFYIKNKGTVFGQLMIPVNVSITAVSTSLTYFVWSFSPHYSEAGSVVVERAAFDSDSGHFSIHAVFGFDGFSGMFSGFQGRNEFLENLETRLFFQFDVAFSRRGFGGNML
jgi:hypothetical protein